MRIISSVIWSDLLKFSKSLFLICKRELVSYLPHRVDGRVK